MDSAEYSRKVAAAMGITPCAFVPTLYAHRPGVECGGEDGCRKPFLYWPDLRDATFRDAAIAWLRAKGISVQLCYSVAEVYVFIYPKQGWKPLASTKAPTIEEAFGRAFLAAMGVQG